jgi:hypothetical protein
MGPLLPSSIRPPSFVSIVDRSNVAITIDRSRKMKRDVDGSLLLDRDFSF